MWLSSLLPGFVLIVSCGLMPPAVGSSTLRGEHSLGLAGGKEIFLLPECTLRQETSHLSPSYGPRSSFWLTIELTQCACLRFCPWSDRSFTCGCRVCLCQDGREVCPRCPAGPGRPGRGDQHSQARLLFQHIALF